MSSSGAEIRNADDTSSSMHEELKTIQFPVEEKIITTDMLDEKISRINTLIHSKDCLLPKTIDASMEECDEFLNLISKFLDQKLLMARKCIHMSHFVEDIYALAALTLTPALVLAIFAFLALTSGSFNRDTTISSTLPIIRLLPQELRPFALCCIPLVLYLAYVFFIIKNHQSGNQPAGGPIEIDEVVSKIYPRLKSVSDLFHDNERRQRFLFLAYAITGIWGIYLIGINPFDIISRLCGLILVTAINYLIGLSLTTFPTYAKELHPFYTPLERTVRIISFSPILYAILTTFGTLFTPIVTRRVDYNQLRELSLQVISTIQKKFKGVIAIQKGMRNVRELLKVTTHFQDLAQGLVSLEVDREAGRAIVNEVPKVASKLFNWASDAVLGHLNPSVNASPERGQPEDARAPRQEENKESSANRNKRHLEEID